MDVKLEGLSEEENYALVSQIIIPRPIAWVLSDNGEEHGDERWNLGPFSYFNGITSEPPMIMFSIGDGMANKVKDLQTQVENQTEQISIYDELMKKYENQAQIDSMLISFKTQQVNILKDREVLYEKQIKLVKPKWYENKWLYFTFGVVATSVSVKLAGEIVD